MGVQRMYLTREEQIQFLFAPERAVVLECFLGRSDTVSGAVAFKGGRLSRPRLAYWVRRMLDLGLLEEVGRRREGRRCVPIYRCVAEEFVLTGRAAYVASTQPGGSFLVQQRMLQWLQTTSLMHIERLGDDWSVRCYRPNEHYVLTEYRPLWELEGRAAPRPFSLQDDWLRLRLPRAQAAAFMDELAALTERLKAASLAAPDDSGPFYIGHLALVEDLD